MMEWHTLLILCSMASMFLGSLADIAEHLPEALLYCSSTGHLLLIYLFSEQCAVSGAQGSMDCQYNKIAHRV